MMDADKFDQLVKALASLAYPRPVNVLPGNAPAWVGLTDEEINSWDLPDKPTVAEFARFVESKIKERNT
jgi:hypothetical protein